MSVSISPKKLEQIGAFSEFLDLLSRPKELKSLVEDIRASTEDYKKAIEAKAKVDDVDRYVKEQEDRILAENAKTEESIKALMVSVEAFEKRKEQHETEQRTKGQAAEQAEQARLLKQKEVEEREVAVTAREKSMESQYAMLQSREADLQAAQIALAAKLDAFKALAG